MLESLSIKNIALIHEESINFTNGLNVLTGETGAGKSLIIDSLSLLLGEKADKSLISKGQDYAYVEAAFTNLNSGCVSVLNEFGIEVEEPLIISRKISVGGKNECRVNGNLFTLSMLKRLTSPLMDLHGQFEHQNLLKVSSHIKILDSFGAASIVSIRNRYQDLYHELESVERELEALVTDERERMRLIDLYTYQIDEIDKAAFYDGEEEELKAFRLEALNSEKLLDALSSAISLGASDGYGEVSASELVKKMSVLLGQVSGYTSGLDEIIERLDSVKIELDDIVDTLSEKRDNYYFDENKIKQNEERLDLLSSFKKKYGKSIAEILNYRDETEKELDKLINSAERANTLSKRKISLLSELVSVANDLTKARRKEALKLEKEITSELSSLGMKSAKFVVKFENLGAEDRNSSGFDKIEFMFSANKGEDIKPLKAVASGGEMSRFMLAVKNVTAKIEGISTLIFDEVDTGVSGAMALVLGEKLASVSNDAQVICVTHLSQVAAFGKSHYLISKTEDESSTQTNVRVLSDSERVLEIARLVSGKVTDSSKGSASELLTFAKNFYKNLK